MTGFKYPAASIGSLAEQAGGEGARFSWFYGTNNEYNADISAKGMDMRKETGLQFYIADNTTIRELNLSTAYDIGSASYIGEQKGFSFSGKLYGIRWADSGSRLYSVSAEVGQGVAEVRSYTTSTPWAVSGLIDENVASIHSEVVRPGDIYISPNEDVLFTGKGETNTVEEYTFGTPGDITTLTYQGSISAIDIGGLDVVNDGKLLIGFGKNQTFMAVLNVQNSLQNAEVVSGFPPMVTEEKPGGMRFMPEKSLAWTGESKIIKEYKRFRFG